MKIKIVGMVVAAGILLAGCGEKSSAPEAKPALPKPPVAIGGGQYQLVGVGTQLTKPQREEPAKVVSVIPGSPAEKAGTKAGWLILAIDGSPTAGRTLADCVNQVRGEAGTQVKFTMADPDSGQTNELVLTRATVTFGGGK